MDTNVTDLARPGPAWNLKTPAPPGMPAVRTAPQPPRLPSGRFNTEEAIANLGRLSDLIGTWEGDGYNMIARPNFHGNTDLYLQVNRTREMLKFDPIGSPVPNRGFGQDDINLYGLTYLQKITDKNNNSALHIEPGIWVTQPATNFPSETAPAGAQLVARMGSIPHGNAVLLQGIAEGFTGAPVLPGAGQAYRGSRFLSFNSTPIGAPPTVPANLPPVFSAHGSSSKGTAAANPGVVIPFTPYDVSIPPGVTNQRSPFGTNPPEVDLLPNTQDAQEDLNDPILLLQNVIADQVKAGYTFEGTALNIATTAEIDFFATTNSPVTGPTTRVSLPDFGGGAENIRFLFDGATPTTTSGNAQTATIYATFWIEKVTMPGFPEPFLQLQYIQTVVLNFPVRSLLPRALVNLGWPHITVGTLRKTFG